MACAAWLEEAVSRNRGADLEEEEEQDSEEEEDISAELSESESDWLSTKLPLLDEEKTNFTLLPTSLFNYFTF
jgi:hypothetical protein